MDSGRVGTASTRAYLWSGTNIYVRAASITFATGFGTPLPTMSNLASSRLWHGWLNFDPALQIADWGALATIPAPMPAPVGLQNASALQGALILSEGADPPLIVDDSYGRLTTHAWRL